MFPRELTMPVCLIAAVAMLTSAAVSAEPSRVSLKTESFDVDPKWDAHNNRLAKTTKIKQDFGYRDGKIGGLITIANEPAYYARPIPVKSLNDKLSASGRLVWKGRSGMALFGFFNADTLDAWRGRNTLMLRMIGRDRTFEAHGEYATARFRAGSNQFTGNQSASTTGAERPAGLLSGDVVHEWSLTYDPDGNNGQGTLTATVDGRTTVTELNPGHKLDGGTFNRLGLLNVMKHADEQTELWIDDLVINGEKQDLTKDPGWEAFHNRREYETRDDRPYSDYGYSRTHFAGGKAAGELGGLIFRGDVRLPDGLNYCGDRIGQLSLAKPLRASGRIAFRRSVQDSSTLIGFFHVPISTTIDPNAPKSPRNWFDYLPRNFCGVAIKGPTREAYFFHPTYRLNGDEGGGNPGNTIANCPRLNPDGAARDWSFEYSPDAAGGKGQIKVTLEGQSATLDLPEGHKSAGATFNRFGIVSNWVDGNGQVVFLDDLTYTAQQE